MIQPQPAVSNSPADNVPSSSGSTAPFPATSHSAGTQPVTTGAASAGTTVYRSGMAYEQVFAQEYTLGQAQDVFSYTLHKPPLIIECEMNPEMVSREQLVDIGKASERYITSTYTDPNAWLDLKVTDADSGKVVTTISFSKNYVGMMKQEHTIRSPGNYRFDMTGNRVSPKVRLLVKK